MLCQYLQDAISLNLGSILFGNENRHEIQLGFLIRPDIRKGIDVMMRRPLSGLKMEHTGFRVNLCLSGQNCVFREFQDARTLCRLIGPSVRRFIR